MKCGSTIERSVTWIESFSFGGQINGVT